MVRHNVDRILTFNMSDFSRFVAISPIDPSRVYPPKPRVGLRAAKPNEYWHVDTTIVRLVDGSRVYLQAVLDNFSRRILSWQLSDRFDTTVTAAILQEAAKALPKTRFHRR